MWFKRRTEEFQQGTGRRYRDALNRTAHDSCRKAQPHVPALIATFLAVKPLANDQFRDSREALVSVLLVLVKWN